MAGQPPPCDCSKCDDLAQWLIEDLDPIRLGQIARSCDECLPHVLRDLDVAPVAVTEVIE